MKVSSLAKFPYLISDHARDRFKKRFLKGVHIDKYDSIELIMGELISICKKIEKKHPSQDSTAWEFDKTIDDVHYAGYMITAPGRYKEDNRITIIKTVLTADMIDYFYYAGDYGEMNK